MNDRRWFSKNVLAIGLLSLFSDMGHEMITAVLPLFLTTFGGPGALGLIEGISDASAALVKLWMSHLSDSIGKRRPVLIFGYTVTALMSALSLATAWWQILLLRVVAWIGRGSRGPVRDALLAESVPVDKSGKAFGFEGAMDTLGAIIGPAIALSLIGILSYRQIFALAFIPSAFAICIALFFLKDTARQPHSQKLMQSLSTLPTPFWRFTQAVGIFGLGNFAHTLLILQAVALLTPKMGASLAGKWALGLYIFHNVIYAAASFPVGILGDRVDKRLLLTLGYFLFGIMCLGFIWAGSQIWVLSLLFALAGIYIAIVDVMERSLTNDFLPEPLRATGFGALATVNSIGDLISSTLVGLLWTQFSAAWGFAYAAVMTLLGTAMLFCLVTAPKRQIL